MIKKFKTNSEYNIYTSGGLKSGDLYYVEESNSVHFKTNNITGSDYVFNLTDDGYISYGTSYITSNGNYDVSSYANAYVDVASSGGSDEPEYTELNLNTLTVHSNGKNFSTMITATVGQTIEIYNPNHLDFNVGQGQPNLNLSTGENDGYQICQNGISSLNVYSTLSEPLEHLYVTNAPNDTDGGYSEYGFCIAYYSEAGTPIDGVIYYRKLTEPLLPSTAKWSNTHNEGTTMDSNVSYNESVIAVQVGGKPVTCTFDGTPSTGWTITQNGLGKSTASVTLNGLDITVDPSMANDTNGVKKLTVSRDEDSSYSAGTAYFKVRVLSELEDTNFFWNAKEQNIPVGDSKFVRLYNYYSSTNIQFTSDDPNISVVGGYDNEGYYGATVTSIGSSNGCTITATLYDTNNNELATATMNITSS